MYTYKIVIIYQILFQTEMFRKYTNLAYCYRTDLSDYAISVYIYI